ncbi:MAG: hypothetical protein WB462_07650 [Solirubrobacterales bacterium]
MRANTKQKHKMGKRFAIVICVAAAGVMALGAQTALAATYNTKLTITEDQGSRGHALIHGHVVSGDRKKCEVGRRVTLFKQKPGADRKLGVAKVVLMDERNWGISVPVPGRSAPRLHVYATVSPKVGDGFVCSGDSSPIYKVKSWG